MFVAGSHTHSLSLVCWESFSSVVLGKIMSDGMLLWKKKGRKRKRNVWICEYHEGGDIICACMWNVKFYNEFMRCTRQRKNFEFSRFSFFFLIFRGRSSSRFSLRLNSSQIQMKFKVSLEIPEHHTQQIIQVYLFRYNKSRFMIIPAKLSLSLSLTVLDFINETRPNRAMSSWLSPDVIWALIPEIHISQTLELLMFENLFRCPMSMFYLI